MAVESRAALEEAERTNAERGHEVGGFVSSAHGFIPVRPPSFALPPSHAAWDEVAAALPSLYRSVGVREALRSMPVLSGAASDLPDEHLLRAVSILSILAHAWVRIETEPGGPIPPPVLSPWAEVTARMGRVEPFMQYNDLILTNWRKLEPASSSMEIENLDLLLPTVGNQTERVFYLTQVEMTARATPLLEAVVRAQEAMAADDEAGVKAELLVMLDVLRILVERSFVKIDPNPLSATHCDPVIWGATVAPFAVNLEPHIPGPGGTSSPVFHLMDAFLGRKDYSSQLGHEATNLRLVAPPLQQRLIEAVSAADLAAFSSRIGSRSLTGLVQSVADAYAGDRGLIAAHRLKAYGFLEVAFKVGRSVTIGGFKGVFRDRPWKHVDNELDITRRERGAGALRDVHRASLVSRGAVCDAVDAGVTSVRFDVAGRGIVYEPGDRCGVLPDNDPALVARTLSALDADAAVEVPLNPPWVAALEARAGFAGFAGSASDSASLALGDFLRFAKLRPVLRETAKALQAVTASARLAEVIEIRGEDQFELWDVLELVRSDGYDVSRLWTSGIWQDEALANLVPPESFRMYSVSSAPDADAEGLPQSLELTVGALSYASGGVERHGTASSFLGRAEVAGEVPVRVVHPRRFRLPEDPDQPVVLFAAGTGIAPFRGFLQARPGNSWLYAAARSAGELPYRAEVDALVDKGAVVARLAVDGERLEDVMALHGDELRSLVVERGAAVYLCGRPAFANGVLATLAEVAGRDAVRRLVADRRLMMDVFTAFAPAAAADDEQFDASEVVLHNNDEAGWWIVVDGMVYDMTEFVHLHPGGRKIIVESAGMDASPEYRAVLHHENSEIEAMLSMYKIGAVRRLRFGGEWGIVLGPDGFGYRSLHDAYRAWVRFLYLVVEMQNALGNDFSYMRMETVRGEPPDAVTPYKLMLFGNTHLRFFDHYFHGSLGDDLLELWAIATGMGAPSQPLSALSERLSSVLGSDAAGEVARFGDRLREVYRDPPSGDAAGALVAAVEEADRWYLESLKAQLRRGVQVFERYEADTMRLGAGELVEILLGVPGLAAAYYARLLESVAGL